MKEAASNNTADNLIHWIRHFASLHIDSNLIDEHRGFSPHVLLEMGNQGFFGLHVSRQYGGLEFNTHDILRVIEQVAAIDLTLVTLLIESIQGGHTFEKYASQSMKDKYLSLLASGRVFTAGAMTESSAGSNPRAMKSQAIPDGDGWMLRGSKRWVGMGYSASVIAIYVQQFDTNNRWVGMSGFLVPQGTKGLNIGADSLTMGLRGFSKNTIYMDDVHVNAENLLGQPGEGMEIAQDNMMYIRLCLAAACIGAMKRCAQLMLRYAERRLIVTGQLLENPVTLLRMSEMTAIIDAIDSFTFTISKMYDEHPTQVPEEAFVVAKIVGSEYLGYTVDLLVQMLGARGYEESTGVAKIYRDARVFRIFEGPTEALNMYIGSRALEKNNSLEYFICNIFEQKQCWVDIQSAIQAVKHTCLSQKHTLFVKPFAIDYWLQSLAGEILSYGLVLACLEYKAQRNDSIDSQRTRLWARNKFNDVVQRALDFSLAEKMALPAQDIKEFISRYTDSIGTIEQTRNAQEVGIDDLLKSNSEHDCHASHQYTELESIAKNDAFRAELLVITEAERQKLLHAWNNTEKNTGMYEVCVHQLFETQAVLTPHAIAIEFDDQTISYQRLNQQANCVAHHLQKAGVKANDRVAIYIERSIDMIVGLLGILKAGAAYLPLDSNYPQQWLAFMYKDAGASAVLSQKKFEKNLPFEAENILCIDSILKPIPHEYDIELPQTNAESIGYVIYTSGSTGQPKGIMLPHKALSNLVNWHGKKIQGKRTVLQFTTLNFDMSFLEIFSALCFGGKLVLISENDRRDLISFCNVVKNKKIQKITISVSFLKNLANARLSKHYFESVKEIIVAGEQLIVTPVISEFFDQNKCKLLNYYGPSETHVVTAYDFPETVADWPDYPPIGKAIANTKLLILNEEKQLVPIGCVGEIYIGGVCLSAGYINNKKWTQEKFITDPWGEQITERLYKTGDFGKFLPDGNVLFLGRKDDQVKIRGFRIYPREIELHLLKYPGIKEAIVIAKSDHNMEKYLEAFIVYDGLDNGYLIEEIYVYLKNNIPVHMLPSAVNVIEQLPLTASGKINRNALEKQERSINPSISKLIEPQSNTEKMLIKIMSGVFKLHIGVNNSFISIGGNSLLAMQIASKLYDECSIRIPASSLLSDPSIAETAKRIDQLIMTNSHIVNSTE